VNKCERASTEGAHPVVGLASQPREPTPHHTMTTTAPTHIHYLRALESYMDPDNGTVSYWYAKVCADLCKIPDAFAAEYGHMEGERIDLGEYNVWVINTL
jgi:hypothetical protein